MSFQFFFFIIAYLPDIRYSVLYTGKYLSLIHILQDIIGIGIMILSTIWLTAYIFQQCITINYLKVLFDKIQYTGILSLIHI